MTCHQWYVAGGSGAALALVAVVREIPELQGAPLFTSWGQVAVFVVAVGVTVGWLWKILKQGGSHNGGTAALVQRMERALDQLVVQQAATATAMAGLAVIVTRLTDRIENMPTKLDLVEAAMQSRHEYRNIIQTTQANILEAIEQAKPRNA